MLTRLSKWKPNEIPSGMQVLSLDDISLKRAIFAAARLSGPDARIKLEEMARRQLMEGDDVAEYLVRPYSKRKATTNRQRYIEMLIEKIGIIDEEGSQSLQTARYFGWPIFAMPTDFGKVLQLAEHPHACNWVYWMNAWRRFEHVDAILKGNFKSLKWKPKQIGPQGPAIAQALYNFMETKIRGRAAVDFALGFFQWAEDTLKDYESKPRSFDKIFGRLVFQPHRESKNSDQLRIRDYQRLAQHSQTAAYYLAEEGLALRGKLGNGSQGWVEQIVQSAQDSIPVCVRYPAGGGSRSVHYKFKDWDKLHPVEQYAVFIEQAGMFYRDERFPFGEVQIPSFEYHLPGVKKPEFPTYEQALDYFLNHAGRVIDASKAEQARLDSAFEQAKANLKK